MATQDHLPEDLVVEILSWLPAKSLVRFKSVCRSWYVTITDHNFALKHFSNSFPNHILLKRLVTSESNNKEYVYSFLPYPLHLSGSVLNIFYPYLCYYPDECEISNYDIRGHSHGLVCLSDLYTGIYLWNPSTADIRELPPTIILAEPALTSVTNAVGFGYNSKTGDLKVVRVMYHADMTDMVRFIEVDHLPRVEIFDLSKNRWREIQTPVCGFVIWNPSFEMYYEGMFYWWAEDDDTEFILSFDMSEEVFGRISVPESFELDDEKYRSAGTLNGSMVLFHYPKSGDERMFDIWKMEKDFVGVSWTKVFTIAPGFGIEKPLAFVSSAELLMEANEGQVVLHNINTQEVKDIPMEGNPPATFIRAVVFVQSLFSVMGGNNIAY
ncbi:F-box protein CPR1, partial [Cucurbita argyrosperma subsp. sororia]